MSTISQMLFATLSGAQYREPWKKAALLSKRYPILLTDTLVSNVVAPVIATQEVPVMRQELIHAAPDITVELRELVVEVLTRQELLAVADTPVLTIVSTKKDLQQRQSLDTVMASPVVDIKVTAVRSSPKETLDYEMADVSITKG